MYSAEHIALYGGFEAIVDANDYDWLMKYNWAVNNNGYAYRPSLIADNKKGAAILMHRQIMNTPQGMDTDHINGNKLDNRRANLRICTNAQNMRNAKKHYGDKATSKYKGVSWKKRQQRWQAAIAVDDKDIHLDTFSTDIEGAIAYNEAAKKYYGEFARLNEIVIPDGFIFTPEKKYSSEYWGVCLHKPSGRWIAKISGHGKMVNIGMYATEIEAAQAYNDAAIKFGKKRFNNITVTSGQES